MWQRLNWNTGRGEDVFPSLENYLPMAKEESRGCFSEGGSLSVPTRLSDFTTFRRLGSGLVEGDRKEEKPGLR